MIKLLIFDLDGTIVDLCDVHYVALNKALSEISESYCISEEEHINKYNGLPTKKKLELVSKEKGLFEEYHEQIFKRKQELTHSAIQEVLVPNQIVIDTFRRLKNDGYLIAVASNSISNTIECALEKAGLQDYVQFTLSNEDVRHPKPSSEIFLKTMHLLMFKPEETIIFEDSPVGLQAANDAEVLSVYKVNSPNDIKYEDIKFHIDFLEASKGFYR